LRSVALASTRAVASEPVAANSGEAIVGAGFGEAVAAGALVSCTVPVVTEGAVEGARVAGLVVPAAPQPAAAMARIRPATAARACSPEARRGCGPRGAFRAAVPVSLECESADAWARRYEAIRCFPCMTCRRLLGIGSGATAVRRECKRRGRRNLSRNGRPGVAAERYLAMSRRRMPIAPTATPPAASARQATTPVASH